MSAAPAPVLLVLDDPGAAARVLEASSALAALMHRELQLVYVESAAALLAAELPMTRVLTQAAQAWAPLAPADVERGWRAHAARLRALAESAALRHAVHWSLRTTRGGLHETALALRVESNLLLVAGAAPLAPLALARAPMRTIAALDEGGTPGQHVLQVASALARAVGARLQRIAVDRRTAAMADPAAATAWVEPADLIVLAGERIGRDMLAALRAPVLLVGAAG
jgi:hypothetical protein